MVGFINLYEKLNSHPLAYHNDPAYKKLHKIAIKSKEFLDYGIESKFTAKKYKKLRKKAMDVLIYFSKTVDKFYTKTLTEKQYNYLLETPQKKILEDIESGEAIGLETRI